MTTQLHSNKTSFLESGPIIADGSRKSSSGQTPRSVASKTAVYGRVSTEEQRDRATILTQQDSAAKYCARNGQEIHDFYLDDGVSGMIPLEERPAGARLLADAQAGKFDSLVIYKVDRLGRDVIVTLTALRQIHALGVRIVSATETLDLATPAGWAMAAVISAFGQLERENFLARSKESTDRLAHEGVWMGGIVPYGYRVEGQDRAARLVVSEAPIPGQRLSEAGIVRLIYRMLSQERASCQRIADHLNALGIPTVYARDERLLLKGQGQGQGLKGQALKGKRRERTQGIWRAGRIRNMVINTTYKGVHGYGKRSAKPREVIERAVPAIVGADEWQTAQEVLRSNMICSTKNARHFYLLRGLVKCGTCGLGYSGLSYKTVDKEKTYYSCNGKIAHRVLYGTTGTRCTAKAIPGGAIEGLIWEDVRRFLLNPGDVLEHLKEQETRESTGSEEVAREVSDLERALRAKGQEAHQVVALCRKGLIDETMLQEQLAQVKREEAVLKEQWQELQGRVAAFQNRAESHGRAEDTLTILRDRLEQPLTPQLKHAIISCLVKRIRVDTIGEGSKKRATVHVLFRFDGPTDGSARGSTAAAKHRDKDSSTRQAGTWRETTNSAPPLQL